MTLKSLSTKLYLAIAAAALAAWALGIPGRTVVSFAAVALMIAMHADGHGGNGGHGMHSGSRKRASSREGYARGAEDLPVGSGDSARGGGCH